MSVLNSLIMVSIAVRDMRKSKQFYAEQLGFEIASDARYNDDNWWVSLTLPGGGPVITLARSSQVSAVSTPGTLSLYLSTTDISAARQAIGDKGAMPGDIQDNLFGPGSGVKFFVLQDPDGNQVLVAESAATPWSS